MELRIALKQMQSWKSTPDSITREMIKALGDIGIEKNNKAPKYGV